MGSLQPAKSLIGKHSSFRSLKEVELEWDRQFEDHPFGVDYGRLENGLVYYVRRNPKPKMRAALALAVQAGSVLEEEEERGVAHIVEHLAFSATKNYENHGIVKFLESIGAQFGPCHNAWTSFDETLYELLVPIDKPELLSQAISILAEFSTEIRIADEDLEKERGAVMEEYRSGRDANQRIRDAYWSLLMGGSKYADRLPIGLEKVIRGVTSKTAKQFYQKWYHLSKMAVIAVGDFPDTESVVELIKTHFSQKTSASNPSPVPNFHVPSHEQPRYSCFVDSEATGSEVMISYKMPVKKMKTIKDYRDGLVESMFLTALNQRFSKISRRKNPPYFSCSLYADTLARPVRAYIMYSTCKEKGTLKALESMLTEVSRARLHGFSEHEISIVRALMMSWIESAYLERDKRKSTSLRYDYVQHFIHNEPVIGIEYEAQLQKTMLPHISASEVSKYAEKLQTSCSCVMKIVEPQSSATIGNLKKVVSEVIKLEMDSNISPWNDEQIPEEIVDIKPNPGNIVKQHEYSNFRATELILSNGMEVCYKCTDFSNDQIIFSGFSYGGLSELSESEYLSSMMGSSFAEEIGVFGHKPSVLGDMLAGKKVRVRTRVGNYMRTFHGECSPSDLETALQLVYQLFMKYVTPGEEVDLVMQRTEEYIRAEERDPYTIFRNRVTELHRGNSYFFKPLKISDLSNVNPSKACEYFNSCFKDPSTFTVVIVGNIDPAAAIPLMLQYLGGIPKPSEPVLHLMSDYIKGLPFNFPTTVVREVVRSPMVEEQCWVTLSFPVELTKVTTVEEILYLDFLSELFETKILQVLRFKHGQIYSASVSVNLSGNMPHRTDDMHGYIRIHFSCDPKISSKLVDIALDEILHLQEEGPSDQDVSTILAIEQRSYENGLQDNNYWLQKILDSYQSRIYSGDIGNAFQVHEEGRSRIRESLTQLTTQSAMQRIMPYPCKNQYTAVILMAQPRASKWLRSALLWKPSDRDTKILAGVAGLTVLAFSFWRHSRKS
ncbi:hypothetical protein SLEP1_g37144 [Rubroshorea leprosula]|uniref:Zinc protease PQQL-like n=1 Tax=Rubroshorea leprosula TaxID=152421 RepID=A0AAV5KTQ9_9ROSI|nr:hypothetical protein SLEP1_g37144 [Rubroshorea leprosula]